jgi:hypothetical protein
MHALDRQIIEEITPQAVLDALPRGAANGVSVAELVRAVTGDAFPNAGAERHMRHVIVALCDAGHPVCAMPNSGYFLAANDSELDAACEFLYSRAMTSLRRIAALKRVALPNLRGQLRLPEGNDHECDDD